MTDLLSGRRRSSIPASTAIGLFFVTVLIILIPAQASSWEYSEFSFDADSRIAMMAEAGRWNPYFEARGTYYGAEPDFFYYGLTAGTYLKVAPWLKLGAFYRFQSGARHLEDWVVVDNIDPIPDEHSWADSSGRYEHLLLGDATPRFLLPWMPGGDWVTALKIRYSYNFRNGEQTLLLRPGLTWVMMQEREPVLNLTLQYPLYFALNFGEAPLYGHGPYFSVLWHTNSWLKLEGRLQYLNKTYAKWEHGGLWTLHSHHLAVGIGIVFTPDFGI